MSPQPPGRLCAVVLNFRTPELTRRAIGALFESRRRIDEIVLVDNDAEASCRELAFRSGERLTYLANGANLGFPVGMNRGIRHALAHRADLVLLVNSDTVVAPDAVGRLEQALAAHPEAAIVAPVLLAHSDPNRVGSAGFHFRARSGRVHQVGFGRSLSEVAPPIWQQLTAASGCLLLIRRQLFERVGLFDEDFFFSFEDLELCLRARNAGFGIGLVGNAHVLHEGSASISDGSPERFYFAARNHLLAAERGAPLASPILRQARRLSIIALNVAHSLRSYGGSRFARLRAVLEGIVDFSRGRYGAAGHAPDADSTTPR